MFLKIVESESVTIVESESVTIYQIGTSEFHYGHAAITSLEEIDDFALGQIVSYRRHGPPIDTEHALPVMWATFFCDDEWICIVMTTVSEGRMDAYLMSDSGETIEHIV